MKTIQLFAALLLMLSVTACDADNGVDPVGAGPSGASDLELIKQTVDAYPVYSLSQDEIDGLILMREEEKLARDVYLHFADAYSLQVFANIAQSEAQHMSAIKVLLDKYGLADPVTDDSRGVFTDAHLADLYAQLTAAGDAGLLEALVVGATIEDLDIKDLMDLSDGLDKEDILFVYANLTKGSRNHMRAFYSQILANGGSYQPQFISQSLFDSIVSSARERGRR
ncbi:MAG: DUF2202 domain-containing protein [Bacteroidetes bacterium]|nr:DUF2202 domain-containing protein [Bacteroidota bacterium]